MTDVVVERLRIACRAVASAQADALAVRRRLEAVARRELPRALERRGRGWGDLDLANVAVELDFDPRAHDDETIAVLWADRIGAAVERAATAARRAAAIHVARGRASEAPAGIAPGRMGHDAMAGPAGAPAGPAAAAPWAVALVDAAMAGDAAALLRLAAALDVPELRPQALDAIPPGKYRALARRLEAAPTGAGAASASTGNGAAPAAGAPGASDAGAGQPGRARRRAKVRPDAAADRVQRGAELLRRRAEAAAVGERPSPLASTVLATSCAGLVLAYPWLGSVLSDAADARSRLDPVVARRLALAAVAGELPAGMPADDDPLVLLLAGQDLAEPAPRLAADPEHAHAAAAADRLLRRLAADLPGFARSSPGFIRRELVARAGTLDPAADPVPVTLAPVPLDVVVALLPYPLGIFRLPWTREVTIRLQEGVMLAAPHVAELERALAGLAAVLRVRLSERLPETPGASAPGAPSVGGDLPVLVGPEALPPAATFAGDGPLGTVVADVELDGPDPLLLTAALASEIDERYAALFTMLSGRSGAPPGLTGEGARNLGARTVGGRLAAAERLSPGAPLRAAGLVRLGTGADDGRLAGRLRIDPDLACWLLDTPREIPNGTAEFPAVTMTTVHTLDEVVAPAQVRSALTGLVARIRDRQLIAVDWGFARHHDSAGGVVCLFHGPPGTGKTMAAAVIAREAGLPAFRIDLSTLISKYIGETEKNLARVFDVAERSDCMLVFDEADAIFGRRTEIGEARDRYANQEVSYLLQRIERHRGVVVLTTNLFGNIDEAFQRRIDVMVAFPQPTQVERRRLWQLVLPPELPVAAALDVERLAERFEMTGAQIRDATLDAAYLAADDGQVVTHDHLITGIRRQYAKAGLMLPAEPR